MANREYGFGNPEPLGGVNFKSDSDLSVIGQKQDLVLVWRLSSKVMASRFSADTWGTPVDTGARTGHFPAITFFQGNLYLFWRNQKDKKLELGILENDTLKVSGVKTVPGMETRDGVAAAVYGNLLYVLHIGKTDGIGGTTIYQITWDGTQWSKDEPVGKAQSSTEAPALAPTEERLYLIHRGETEGPAGRRVWWSFNVKGGFKNWSDNKVILSAKSHVRPGAGTFKNYVVVMHAGYDSNDLRCVYCPSETGQWVGDGGDERIGDGYKSTKAPAVTELNGKLLLLFVAENGVINAGTSAFALKAKLFQAPLTVGQFLPRTTPGNVAVCLSGGGSRALSAGMGQLLALETLTAGLTNASLLSQTRVLSTVSGGAWIGVTFTYLPSSVADQSYLGGPYRAPGSLSMLSLSVFPADCIGDRIRESFSLEDLAARALYLYEIDDTPPEMLWQTVIGDSILKPYGLFAKSATQGLPSGYFSYDAATVAEIVKANPSMKGQPVNTVAQVAGQHRPFLICNMAMAVNGNAALVPVQSTPFFTGVIGRPDARDVIGHFVGDGGVASFAFSSAPESLKGETISVEQPRQWSLVDAVGTSSCAYAETLLEYTRQLAQNPQVFAAKLRELRPSLLAAAQEEGENGEERAAAAAKLDALIASADAGNALRFDPDAIVPEYRYWPTLNVHAPELVPPIRFADGGSLENLGLATALSYSDVTSAIAFINTNQPLRRDGNHIAVDDAIPPLFGFQPFDSVRGYVPYTNEPLVHDANSVFRNNQIFPSTQFFPLIDALWVRSAGNTRSPIVLQDLVTVKKPWFGVAGGRSVKVLWVYLQSTTAWSDQLSRQRAFPWEDSVWEYQQKQASNEDFPNYGTFSTQLEPRQVNLLANLTAWTVMNAKEEFLRMYGY
jgi:hypothetical protein